MNRDFRYNPTIHLKGLILMRKGESIIPAKIVPHNKLFSININFNGINDNKKIKDISEIIIKMLNKGTNKMRLEYSKEEADELRKQGEAYKRSLKTDNYSWVSWLLIITTIIIILKMWKYLFGNF